MLYTDQGFVLKRTRLLDDDHIFTLFLKNKGKISCRVKGIKNIKSRKSGNLDALNLCKFSIAKGKTMDIVTEVSIVNHFLKLKESEESIFLMFYLIEVINKSIYDGEVNIDIYNVLSEILHFLNKGTFDQKLVISYLNSKILISLGVFPDLHICFKCKLALHEADKKVYINSQLAHFSCFNQGRVISNSDIKLLNFLKSNNLKNYLRIKLQKEHINSIYLLTTQIIEDTINSQIKSKKYIK